MGVLKVVLPVLGTVQIVLAFLYTDPGFQKKVRHYLAAVLFHFLSLPWVEQFRQKQPVGWVQPCTRRLVISRHRITYSK